MTLRPLIYLIFLLPTISFGKLNISGTVTDQNGDTLPLSNVVICNRGLKIHSTVSDINGQFSFKQINAIKNIKLFANFNGCSSDTILLTPNNKTNLKLIVKISDNCRKKLKFQTTGHN